MLTRLLFASLIMAAYATSAGAATSVDAAKRTILSSKSRMFNDPDSIRDASIGTVAPCPSGAGECVCVELNARNRYGGMTGLQTIGVRITGSDAVAFGEMADTSTCGKMIPFQALNGKSK
jgi:hypothetical protein